MKPGRRQRRTEVSSAKKSVSKLALGVDEKLKDGTANGYPKY